MDAPQAMAPPLALDARARRPRVRWRLSAAAARGASRAAAMARSGLEGLGVGREAPASDSMTVTGNRVQLPQWLFLYLLTQLVGSVWWAATLQSDLRHEIADRAREEEKIRGDVAAEAGNRAQREHELWEKEEAEDLLMRDLREKLAAHNFNPNISMRSSPRGGGRTQEGE